MEAGLNNNLIIDIFLNKKFRIFRHGALIFMIAVITFASVWYLPEKYTTSLKLMVGWLIYMFIFGGIIYANIYWGVPRFLLKKKFHLYFLYLIISTLILVFCIVIVQNYYFHILKDEFERGTFNIKALNVISSLLTLGLMIAGTSALLIFKDWMGYNQRINELETATLESELKLLKNQINPHFLFNMLNNAMVLVKKNKEEASRILFKLEDLLRYQLNESKTDKVPLLSDIRFLNDYLNLEKIRRDDFQYKISKEGDISHVRIPALLFITFVENAVKHNFDSEKKSYVYISFRVIANNLVFICENSKPVYQVKEENVGGLGLKNIKRRLELLYPNRHILKNKDEDSKYTVLLMIAL